MQFLQFSQVSDLCPREYPTQVEIRVFRFNSGILEDEHTFPVSVTEIAIIIFEDAFTLDSNERYKAEVFFQIPDGNFNISGAVNFSEYLHVESTVIRKFFVRLNFAFKIFVVKNFRQYFVLKFFREETFKMQNIFG